MKLKKAAALSFALILTASCAQARTHRHRVRQAHTAQAQMFQPWGWTQPRVNIGNITVTNERPADCYGIPWCGCWLRHAVGVADKAYNRAISWLHYGSATSPHVGAIVVWAHHVALITGQASNGQWIMKSGNDGHAVRERQRSLAGAIAFRE